MRKFGFKEKIDKIIIDINDDNTMVRVLTINLAIFAVSGNFLLSNNTSTTDYLFLFSSILTLFGALLNTWYLARKKKRMLFFKEEQEKIYNETKEKIIKIFHLLVKIVYGVNKNKNNKNVDAFEYVFKDFNFVFDLVMELNLKDSLLSVDKCLGSPLEEKGAEINLVLDRLSDKTKYWSLALGTAFVICGILIKSVLE